MSTDVAEITKDVVPSRILDFIKGYIESNPEPWTIDASSLYGDLIDFLPNDSRKPTYNQWIFFYNVHKRQQMVDKLHSMIFESYKTLQDLNTSRVNYSLPEELEEIDREIRFVGNRLKDLEKRYNDLSRDLFKYVNDAINREVPKKHEHITRVIKPSDIIEYINKSDETYVEAEFEVKES